MGAWSGHARRADAVDTADAVDAAARAVRANREAVFRLGFAHGLTWARMASAARLAEVATSAGARPGPAAPEVARVQQRARELELPACAESAAAGFRAAVRAVVARVQELDRHG